MFCPRCGSPNTETTKFCRQCGLSLTQVTDFVSSGGTAPISTPSSSTSPVSKPLDGMTPKQRLVLTILLFVFAPAFFGVVGKALGAEDIAKGLAGISSVLMPLGIIWAVFRYKALMRRLQWEQTQQTAPPQTAFQPQTYQPPLPPPQTNPIATPATPERGSITEEETRKFSGGNQS